MGRPLGLCRTLEVASPFHTTLAQLREKAGGDGRSVDVTHIEPRMRQARVPYYGNCALMWWRGQQKVCRVRGWALLVRFCLSFSLLGLKQRSSLSHTNGIDPFPAAPLGGEEAEGWWGW